MKEPPRWTDEILRACADIAEAPVVMSLLEQLADGKSQMFVRELRDAVAVSDYERAARLQAMAEAWDSLTGSILELARDWREKS